MKRLYQLVVLVALGWQVIGQVRPLVDPKVYIIFCDVGQGDATLIVQGRTQILVDGGPNDRVLECLSGHLPWFDRTLELVVNTHPQQDHLGGLPEVFRRYRVGSFLTSSVANDIVAWHELGSLIQVNSVPVFVPQSGDKLKLGGLDLDVLWPIKQPIGGGLEASISAFPSYTGDLNELSVVLFLHYKSFNLLLPGDIGEKEELAMLGNHLLTETDVLKVAHHGSKFSSGLEFITRVSPSLAVIEVGENNRFGHPTKETMMRLESVGARIKRTDTDGEILVVSDGESFWLP